jgi:eukaryotic-like serine/threonine-protein kinase
MIFQKNANRYARAKEIFFAALNLDTAEQAEVVRLKCGDDTELRDEVESLLAARDEAPSFLELPALKKVSQHENLQNQIIDGYRLIKELGKGGMGVVYLAKKDDGEFRRHIALKIVQNNFHSETFFKRLKLERQILAHLEHPNIVRLIDGGATEDGLPYFVMEYVEGIDLITYAEMNSLPLAERLELFRQVCAAVSEAHRHGIIHRDLKPSNILVTKDGTAKLLDFGIAKILSSDSSPQPETAATFRAMTPAYASPEQIKGETITTLSDVYALGVILYELLTEARPYQISSENLMEIGRAICEVEPALPSLVMLDRREVARKGKKTNPQSAIPNPQLLRGDLDNILLKALRKEPQRRYRSVDELSEDLQRHLKGLPVSARPDTFAYRAEKFIRRNRVAVGFAVLGILALLGGIVATVWQARRAELERARAERRFNEVRALAKSFVFELNDEILKGQTQGRELVVKRALEYLDRLADEAKEDVSLQRELAVAYLKIGDIQGKPSNPNLGDTAGAVESYRKALLILETLYRANPDNQEIQRDLATAYLSIGSMQGVRTLKLGEAMENGQKSLSLIEALLAKEPGNTEYRRRLAGNYAALGDILSNLDEKIAMHRKALTICEELLATEPTNPQHMTAIAAFYQRIGTILRRKAGATKSVVAYQEILEHFNKALAIYEKLQKVDPNNPKYRRKIANILAARLPVQALLGKKAEVINSHKTAMGIFKELSEVDPKNAEAQFDIAYTHQFMCQSLLEFNDHARALKSCREGSKVGEFLFAIDPTNAEVGAYIFRNHNLIAEALKKVGDTNGMLENFHQALRVAEQWLSAEPENVTASRYVGSACDQIGSYHAQIASNAKLSIKKRKEHRQAAHYWLTRGLEILRDLQKRNVAAQRDIIKINAIEQKIARYNFSLKSVK